jgi:hypothetical protein
MILDGETFYMKIVDLEKIWNFIVDNFFYLNSSRAPNNQFTLGLI